MSSIGFHTRDKVMPTFRREEQGFAAASWTAHGMKPRAVVAVGNAAPSTGIRPCLLADAVQGHVPAP